MIIGHKHIIKHLIRAVKSDNLAHAYIFSGPESVGKMTVAGKFAKLLQCSNSKKEEDVFDYCDHCKDCYDIDRNSHPDLFILEKQGLEIKISQIRELIDNFSLKNYSAPYKIAIINNADRMNIESENALLKVLEEPSGNSILILTTSHPEALLPTITSRCRQVKFFHVSYQDMEKGLIDYCSNDPSVLADIPEAVRLSCGKPGIAINFISDAKFKDRQNNIRYDFLKVIDSSLVFRYDYVNSMLSEKNNPIEILNIWSEILRDLAYLYLNTSSFVLNVKLIRELELLKKHYSLGKVSALINKIKDARFILETTNVNKKLALEVLMLEL